MLKVMLTKKRLTWIGAIVLAFFGGLELVRGFSALFAPVSNDYSEMMVAGMAQQLRLTGRLDVIYAPPLAPYNMPGVQYPPLFMVLTSLLVSLTNLGPVLASRLLAWAGYAAAGAMVGLLVWHETRQRRVALCAAFFPFTFWSVLIFINGARPDPLALFLSLLGIYLYRRGQRPVLQANLTEVSESSAENQRAFTPELVARLALVALILVAAFYSKQTYLAAAAAIFFDLLATRGRRGRAILFGGIYGVFGLFGLWLCQVISSGTFAGIFEPERAGRFIFHLAPAMVGFFLLDHAPLILIALGMLVWQWRRKQRFWSLYLFFAALACSSIIKDGAVDYYFNEVAYLLSIQVGLALALSLRSNYPSKGQGLTPGSTKNQDSSSPDVISKKPKSLSSFILHPSSFILLQVVIAFGMFLAWNQWRDNDNFAGIYRETEAIVREYQESGKSTLIWQNNFLIDTGHTELIGDYFIYWILLGNGHRDMQPLLTDLQNRRYEMILVGSPEFRRWPPVLEQSLEQNYNLRVMTGIDGRPLYWLYTRR